MSSEWPTVKLGSLADFQEGYVNPSQRELSYFDGPVKWLRATDLNDSSVVATSRTLSEKGFRSAGKSAVLFEPGTLAISKSGTIGRLGILADYMCGNRAVINIKPKPNSVPRFLFFVLRHLRPTIETLAEGSVQKNLYVSTLSNLDVPAPPKELQQRFADTLGALDDRITLLRETNATLEAIAQALFKSWFVDFDPVRAKIEGGTLVGMDEATAALFPDSFDETELGLVPRGWSLTPFGALLSHTIGGDWGSDALDDKNDTRVAIIRGTDLPDLQSGAPNRVPVRYTSAKKLASRKVEDGDIILEVSGGSKEQPTGRSLYMTASLLGRFDCPVEPASFCRLFRPANKDLGILLAQHLVYIYAAGKTWDYQNQSTGIANFQTTHFLEKELVAVPPPAVLDVFASVVRPLVDRAHAAQSSELAKLRDTLLPRLISGQMRLAEAQAVFVEAA